MRFGHVLMFLGTFFITSKPPGRASETSEKIRTSFLKLFLIDEKKLFHLETKIWREKQVHHREKALCLQGREP